MQNNKIHTVRSRKDVKKIAAKYGETACLIMIYLDQRHHILTEKILPRKNNLSKEIQKAIQYATEKIIIIQIYSYKEKNLKNQLEKAAQHAGITLLDYIAIKKKFD